MESNYRDKLRKVLESRRSNIESISNFETYFSKFIYETLRELVVEISEELVRSTGDELKLFYDDPFRPRETKYFAMVQFGSGRSKKDDFYLNNLRNFPALLFQGDEMKGKLVVTHRRFLSNSQESNKKFYEIAISEIEKDKIADVIIEFIDRTYSI